MSENSDSENYEDRGRVIERSSTFATDNENLIEHPESPEYSDDDELNYEEITAAQPSTTPNNLDKSGDKASESIAIKYLEEAFSQGGITGSEMAFYKKRYKLLSSLLNQTRDNESNLLQWTKKWTNKIEQDKSLLNEADEYPDDSNTEVSKTRQMLLKFENEFMMSEERLSNLEYQVVRLEEEKKMLKHELNRLPGVKDRDLRIRVEKSMEEMKDELSKYISENKELSETQKTSKETIRLYSEQIDDLQETMNSLKSELNSRSAVPGQQTKAFEKLRKEFVEQDELRKTLDIEKDILSNTKDKTITQIMNINEELGNTRSEFNKLQAVYFGIQGQLDELKKLYEQSANMESEMLRDKVKIEFDLNNLQAEKKKYHEEVNQKAKIKERAAKSLKNAELQLKSVNESYELVKQTLDKIRSNYEIAPKRDDLILANIEKRKHEIDHRKKLVEFQKNLSEVEKAKLLQSAQEEERLLYDLSDLRIEVVELTRLAQIKSDEREQKAKEFIQKEKRFCSVIEELKEKNLVIQDYKKKINETQNKLDASAKLYNVIQNERNKFANMITSATQQAGQIREKLRIYDNEIEILKTDLNHKDSLVQKQRSKYAELVSVRDSLRSEISKQKVVDTELQERRKQIQLDIKQLNQMSNEGEKKQMFLQGQYEIALKNRNDRAVQLIERNEEVCILQEKYNIKEQKIRSGEKEVLVRDDEIEFLRHNIKEADRKIDLLKKKVIDRKQIRADILNLKIQLSICQERQKSLELHVENPEKENRARILEGSDPSPLVLQDKIDDLEEKLARKDEQEMEKILLYEAVTKLVMVLQEKVANTKGATLDLATGLNDYKSEMSQLIKRLKARTAELTMNMADSMKLQQEIKRQENSLKEIYEKMENNEEIEIFKIKPRYKANRSTVQDYEPTQFQLTNGTTTTAEPRANAYIPEDIDELPIPRPYGAHAPFKPMEPGSNMRHIKKQKLKPIEI